MAARVSSAPFRDPSSVLVSSPRKVSPPRRLHRSKRQKDRVRCLTPAPCTLTSFVFGRAHDEATALGETSVGVAYHRACRQVTGGYEMVQSPITPVSPGVTVFGPTVRAGKVTRLLVLRAGQAVVPCGQGRVVEKVDRVTIRGLGRHPCHPARVMNLGPKRWDSNDSRAGPGTPVGPRERLTCPWLRGVGSNHRPSGNEPDELPLLHPTSSRPLGI